MIAFLSWLLANISPVVSSAGLVLDIVGVWFVFKYGLPESIDRSGHIHIIVEQADQTEIAKGKHYDRMARLGLLLLIVGFLLQLVGNWF
jgi:hypothetical protein